MVLWVLWAACSVGSGSTDPLDATFGERLTDGYHCGLGWYLSHDPHRSIRLQADLWGGTTYPPDTSDLALLDGTLGDDPAVMLQVYVGKCLMTPGCTDDSGPTPGCSREQEIVHIYDATAGDAHLERHDDGTVSGTVADLVLEGHEDEPIVEVADLVLPPLPEWVE